MTKTKLSVLGLLCVALTGCHTVELEFANGAKGKVQSFGRQSSIEELSLNEQGTLRVKGYNNDEVTGLGIAVGALKELATKTQTGGVTP